MADITDPRGKFLLGEAVRLLVQSGVGGVAVADFITEYSKVLHTTLAAPEPTKPVSLKDELKSALAELLNEQLPAIKSVARSNKAKFIVLINGTRTSLSIPTELLLLSKQSMPAAEVKALIQELAESKPEAHPNRSAWVSSQLEQHLVLLRAESSCSSSTTH